jgi:acetyl-CoA C-acetyltransferase
MLMAACIVGWSHSRFGKLPEESLESLLCAAAADAVRDAGIDGHDIDEIYVGAFNPGFVNQDFPASLVLNRLDGLRFKPATRVENACATGSAAIYQAANSIAAKKSRIVLVIGAEKMTELGSADIGRALLKASYVRESADIAGGFAGIFGKIAEAYFARYGDQSRALASIAAKNHANAVGNPYAHMRNALGFEFCCVPSERNPFVAGPLKRTDCSLISEGAAALVLTDEETARTMPKAVRLRGMEQTTDFMPLSKRADVTNFEAATAAWQQAVAQADIATGDLDFIELHDCFTISELILYEALGIAKRGEGAHAALEGVTGMEGSMPVNPSGGLKAKGHPIGATGVSMHVLAAMQLAKQADGFAVKHAELGGVFNMGGVSVANYASIMEVLR